MSSIKSIKYFPKLAQCGSSYVSNKPYSCNEYAKTIPVLCPFTQEKIAEIKTLKDKQIDEIVNLSHEAYKLWKDVNNCEKSEIFLNAHALLLKRQKEIAELETVDTGKAISETTADVAATAETLKFFAAQLSTYSNDLSGRQIVLDKKTNTNVTTYLEPLGVCLGIGAWNFPITNIAWKVAPALAAGNAMIYKPSETTPLSSHLFAEIMAEAGLPPNTLNIVQGDGDTCQLLLKHPKIAKVSYTGSDAVGRIVYASCAQTLKKVTLELGGKSGLIVFDDCDVDSAVNGALMANFFTQGQVCSNASKIYVHKSIKRVFTEKFIKAVEKIKIGDPLVFETNFGSMVSVTHANRVVKVVENAMEQGAKLIYGTGKIIEGTTSYLGPCILDDCTEKMDISRDEIFGPVACLYEFETEEEVVERVNATKYGLAGGLYSNNMSRVARVVAKMDASTVYVNTYNVYPVQMGFGGRKSSGFGRENGFHAILDYADIKSVYYNMDKTDFPF